MDMNTKLHNHSPNQISPHASHPQSSFTSLTLYPCFLHFEYGKSYPAFSNINFDLHPQKKICGEAAFTTGMTGYEESLTDPSFLGQCLIFTAAHVGNYQSKNPNFQNSSIETYEDKFPPFPIPVCVIIKNLERNDYFQYLIEHNYPLITNLDTREIVRGMTSHPGKHRLVINSSASISPDEFVEPNYLDITNDLQKVSIQNTKIIRRNSSLNESLVLIDYGVKKSIVTTLKTMAEELNLAFVQVPHHTNFENLLSHNPKLIFLSNGPGDPRLYKEEIKTIQKILDETSIPLRGICLGHQILSLALGFSIMKLPFGQRGMNHPVYDCRTQKVLITSQNHGFAIDHSTNDFQTKCFELNIMPYQYSLFDHSIEGIISKNLRVQSVQYHPENSPGPKDAEGFFLEVKEDLLLFLASPSLANQKIADKSQQLLTMRPYHPMSQRKKKNSPFKKILLIGSGPIKIGQASEFDYSGTQALKALREEGIEVVLLNSNPATIMTDPDMCSQTYIEPITKEVVKKIVERENIDGVLSTMGGQTALNLCVELFEEGFFQNHQVELLGANVETIRKTEDRNLFAQELKTLGFHSGLRFLANSIPHAIKLANNDVGYPLIIRRDFALGGKGAALIYNEKELLDLFSLSEANFPLTLERSLVGFKEIELEVMVDSDKNGVIVCGIENIDPCGVHTGDSITVAPPMTISDQTYQILRDMALKIAVHMGVVAGGANVQFAINPHDEFDITVIEMNPRVSRSSALASKATGYPIAKISALLSIGYKLHEIMNDITTTTPVSFEPSLDYVALKIPIFPFDKFPESQTGLGPQMRSVGEVLALGGNFCEAFQKALRSLELGLEIPKLSQLKNVPLSIGNEFIRDRLKKPQELCLLTVLEALRLNISSDEIFKLSGISPWFISQMELIVRTENLFLNFSKATLLQSSQKRQEFLGLLYNAKKIGFSDKFIAFLTGHTITEIFQMRFENAIRPVFKAVDTCAGEFKATTPYFYSTYGHEEENTPLNALKNALNQSQSSPKSYAVFGSGPNRIGQGIEFDYSAVKCTKEIMERGHKAIMINSNPETVSTDYDSSHRLYLSPLFSEDLFEILSFENPQGIIANFAGQTGIKLREHLERGARSQFQKFPFLGSSLQILELTEDRKQFADFLNKANVGLAMTRSKMARGHKALVNAITDIGFPVIIRPSYVIGGESMFVFHGHNDIDDLPDSIKIPLQNNADDFLVENYLQNALEYDVDIIRDQFGNMLYGVTEHIEYAGVHSGDSGMITPPVRLPEKMQMKLKSVSMALAEQLQILGPVNFQFAILGQDIYCIEANPRGSRTLPFLSKALGISFPTFATQALLGLEIAHSSIQKLHEAIHINPPTHFSVKQSTFPFDRFYNDSILLGPKMRSTGETMGIDLNKDMAVLKSYQGNYPILGRPGKILLSLSDDTKTIILPYLQRLDHCGFAFVATKGTAHFINQQGFSCSIVHYINNHKKIHDTPMHTITSIMKDPELVLVLNTPTNKSRSKSDGEIIRNTAISHGLPCFTREENIIAILQSIMASQGQTYTPFLLQSLKGNLNLGKKSLQEIAIELQ